MNSEDEMDYDSDADEVQEIESSSLASLRSKKFSVNTSDGTLRCPWSPSRKKQAYAYKDLLQHATAVSTGRRGAEAVGQHRALKVFLETDLVHLTTPPVERVFKLEQKPPERMVNDLKHVFPWSVVVYNIDNSIRDPEKGIQVGVGRSELRTYFSVFKPVQVEVMWNHLGHLGQCVLHFEGSFSGMKDALALENHFLDREHGRRDYEKRAKNGNLGKDFYGWVATEEDVQGRFGSHGAEIAKYLSKYGTVKDVEVMEQDMKKIYDQQVRHLKVTVTEKEQRNARLATEMEVMRRTSEAQREQQEIQHKIELESLRAKAKESDDRYAQVNLDSNRALEKKDAELCQLYKDLEEKKSLPKSEAESSQLEIQMKKNREIRETLSRKQAALSKNQANMVKLLQKNEEELRQLAEKHHQEEVKLLKRQKMEAKEHQLQDMIEIEEIEKAVSGLGINDEAGPRSMDVDTGPTEASKRIEELEAEIAEMKDESEYQNHTLNQLLGKERKANDELDEARLIGIETLRFLEDKENIIEDAFNSARTKIKNKKFKTRPQIGVKMVGSIDETPWVKAFMERDIDEETGAKELSSWGDRIRNSNYQPYKREKYGPGDDDWKQVVNGEEQHLSTLKKNFGEPVYQTVVVALQELEEYNPSGRYPLARAWNFDKSKLGPANLKDVLGYISLVTEALLLRINPTNKRSRA